MDCGNRPPPFEGSAADDEGPALVQGDCDGDAVLSRCFGQGNGGRLGNGPREEAAAEYAVPGL